MYLTLQLAGTAQSL